MSFLPFLLSLFTPIFAQTSGEFPVPASFTVEGVPAIKAADVEHLFYDPSQVKSNLIWDVDVRNRSMLITDERSYIYHLDAPMGKPRNLIDGRVPNTVRVSPKGGVFAFVDDKEDADNLELYLRDEKGQVRKLSSFSGKDESVESLVWDEKGETIFYAQVDYESKTTRLCGHDLSVSNCYQLDLKGIWYVLDFRDGKALLKHWKSSSNQSLYLYDTALKKLGTVEDKGNSTKGFFGQGRVFWLSEGSPDCGPETCLMSMEIKTGRKARIKLPNEIANLQDVKISPDKKSFLIQEMKDGIDNLRVGKLKKNAITETVTPFVRGSYVIWNTRWLSDKEIVYTTENVSKPASIEVFDLSSKRSTSWTKERVPTQFENKVKPPEVIKWKSFDGREISGYMIKPQGSEGRSPVLIFIHGGPQVIDRPVFNPQALRFAAHLGLTVIHTNIRGSKGFGLEFMDADNWAKRGDAVKDISALLDWIERQPELDPTRIIVRGESYGGFIALASALQESKRVKAVIAEYPLVSIRGLLGQSWIDEFAIAEYGDPKDEKLMKQLDDLSPLNNTDRWSGAPLFMTRGGRDERNPERDVLGLKSQLRDRGNEVWFIYAKEAGHGVAGRYVTAAMYEFLKKQLRSKENK
ncbi:MAG: S9 family peptidase [Acidobacteria bacterium]|nr:S9 family peptidase [Acidobacteriota bacterium]